MTLYDLTREQFKYDGWANQQWLSSLVPGEIELVFEHILWAQEIWIERCGVHLSLENLTFSQRREQNTTAWLSLVESFSTLETITYTRKGVSEERTMLQVYTHILSHGAYHRGQLRGLSEKYGVADWPETGYNDFLRFKAETGSIQTS